MTTRPPVNRKIVIDPTVYLSQSQRAHGGDDACDHDFDPLPVRSGLGVDLWTCTKCGHEVTYETWD